MWGMNLQRWIDANGWVLGILAPAFVIAVLCAVFFLVSELGGWALMARRFRAEGAFAGESWSWQSAQLRGWCNYNNCLTVGANPESLYLSVIIPFRLFHPALLIPWTEIEVETGKVLFGFIDTAVFRIGTEERVRVRIFGKLVRRVRQAAGRGWPLFQTEEMERQTRQ
jgi:hypothetical protein